MTVLIARVRNDFPVFLFAAIATVSFINFSIKIFRDFQSGGNPWKQGDWLINSENGPIRRSFSGDFMIWLSDLFDLHVVTPVVISQILIAFVLYIATYRLVVDDKSRVLALLAFSASFFMFFWVGDPYGAGRKELIAFAAMVLIAIALNYRNQTLAFLGFFLFPVSVLCHEAMILFLPAVAGVYAFYFNKIKSSKLFHICFFLSVSTSLIAFYIALKSSEVSDYTLVCQPLTARGAHPDLCSGAIKWLEHDVNHAMEQVRNMFRYRAPYDFVVGYLVALAPALFVAVVSNNKALSFALIVFSGLPFLPLYAFAVDYGRWISFHSFSVFLLFSSAIASGKLVFEKPIKDRVYITAFTLGAVICHLHVSHIYLGGSVRRLATDAIGFLE